jgi:hypothetical protein
MAKMPNVLVDQGKLLKGLTVEAIWYFQTRNSFLPPFRDFPI